MATANQMQLIPLFLKSAEQLYGLVVSFNQKYLNTVSVHRATGL